MENKSNNNQRKPAHELLFNFLKENKLGFFVRKQQVRYLEDNSLLIETPQVVCYYLDDVSKLESSSKEEQKVEVKRN